MGTVTKRGKRWRAEIWKHGIRKGHSFDTKAEAHAWVADTERLIRAGGGVEVAGRTLGDALRKFSEEECPHRNKGEWERVRLAFLAQDELARTPLADLTPEAVQAWQRRQLLRVSGATVRRDRALLSAVMAQAVRIWRWLPVSPFKAVRLPPDNPHRQRVATQDEIERLWHVVGNDPTTVSWRSIAAFELAVESGMRGGEIVSIEHEHWSGAVIRLSRTKNGDARDVALSPRAQEILRQVRELGLSPLFGLNHSQKDALFRKVREKAGIVGLTFHDARHTACTRLAKRLTVLELARQLGHRDLNSLLIYYQDSAEERATKL